jgi:hypothetical protein
VAAAACPLARFVNIVNLWACVATREKSDSKVNVGLERVKAKVDFD